MTRCPGAAPTPPAPCSLNPSSALRDPLPHLVRCVELAREQRNDFFLARCAIRSCCLVV